MFDLFADALMDVLTGTDKEEHNHSLLSQRYTLVAEPPKSLLRRDARKELVDVIRSGRSEL